MINPSAKYPAQTAVDLTNYPYGKARNVTGSGDGTGTPLEKDWINDIWGFFQALAAHAGITPSNSPDTAVSSQLMDAVCVATWLGVYSLTPGVNTAAAGKFPLSTVSQFGGYSLASNQITVPVAGRYRVTVSAFVNAQGDSSNPLKIALFLNCGSAALDVGVERFSGSTLLSPRLSDGHVFTVADPSTDKISLSSNFAGAGSLQIAGADSQLVVERVG